MEYISVTENSWSSLLRDNRDEMSGFDFQEINLTEQDLKNAVFIECKFTSCNLSNHSLMNVVLRDVLFENCNLMGINWTEVRNVRNGGSFGFKSCKLDYACFQSMDLRGVDFGASTIREADFSSANLSKANLSGGNYAGTSFANVNIEKADFRGAKNYFIDPAFAKLKQAKFSYPEALVLIQAMGAEVEF